MSTSYKIVFQYDGKEPSEYTKARIESAFVRNYNEFCDAVNPHYEEWNASYHEPAVDDNDEFNSDYISYVNAMVQPYIDKINAAWKRHKNLLSPPIREFFVGNDHNFCARLNDGTKVNFFLKAE